MSESIGWATLSVIPSMKGALGGFDKEVTGAMATSGKSAGGSFIDAFKKSAPTLAVVAVAASIAAIGVESVKMATQFQTSTTQLVTGAGESEKSLEMVRQGLLKMAPAVGMGPEALAKAMFLVESAGYRGAAGLIVMKAAAEGAKIGGADATVVANGLTTALTDYHLPASQAAEITSKLVATVAAGKTNMQDLAGSMSTVLPFAASLGVGFNNLMGAMATMTSEGISADTSATMLKFTLMSLANETPKGKKALDSVGLSAAQVHDALGTKGLSGTLAMVTDAVGKKFPAGSVGYTAAMAAIAGGTRGMGAVLALTGKNMATYQKDITNIGAAATEAGGHVRGWALTQADLGTRVDQVKAQIAAWATSLGMTLIPIITQALGLFVDWIPSITSFAGAINGDLSAAFGVVGADITQFLSGFAQGRDELGRWGSIWAQFGAAAHDTITAIKGWVADFISGFHQGRTELGKWGSDFAQWGAVIGDAFRAIKTAVGDFITQIKDGTGFFGNLRNILFDLWKSVMEPQAAFITAILIPAFLGISKWIIETGVPALGSFLGWLNDNSTTIGVIAGVITALLLPAFISMAVQAGISGLQTAAVWLYLQADAIASVAVQVAQMVVAGLKWAWQGAQAFAAGAVIAGVWLEQQAKAIAGALVVVFQLGLTAAGWVASATTATASSIVMAAAWVVGLGPVAWIIAAIALVVGAFVALYVKVGWFHDAVNVVWGAIKEVFRMAIAGIVDMFLGFAGAIVHTAAVAFGWIPGIGPRLTTAAAAFDTFRKNVNDSILGINSRTVTVQVGLGVLAPGKSAGISAIPGGVKFGARGGPVNGGIPGKDSVPYVLMPHEYIVRADGSNLGDAMAHFGVEGMAGGGLVLGTSTPTSSSISDAINAGLLKLLGGMDFSSLLGGAGGGGIPGGGMAGGGNARANQLLAASLLPLFGLGPDQMPPLIKLWNQESGWNQNAYNASSGATGIPQSLPGNKMASAGADWQTNPATQMRWGLGYIAGRYGSPAGAWAHEQQFNWYDHGGILKPGTTIANNGTGMDEYVSKTNPGDVVAAIQAQTAALKDAMAAMVRMQQTMQRQMAGAR